MNLSKRIFMVFALFISSISQAAPSTDTAIVKMKSLSFEPKQIEVVQGQSVVWKNVALTNHSATSEEATALFDTGLIAPGKESKPILFDKAGQFPYHCSVHGKTMSGVVSVKSAAK